LEFGGRTLKKNILVVLATLALTILAAACTVPSLIVQEASWATIQKSGWEPVWKDSFFTEDKGVIPNIEKEVTVEATSRASAWYNEAEQTGLLIVSTPFITLYGASLNPFQKNTDAWVLDELAAQGGDIAKDQLDIAFDPFTVPLIFQETITAETPLGTGMIGSRFLAQTPEGNGYVIVLRGIEGQDILVLIIATQSLSAIESSTEITSFLRHPASEPTITNWIILAENWAKYYGLDVRLLKAVVEAEGAKNIPGDFENGAPHAFGYGQVWPKWHHANVQRAIADVTGVSTSTTDEQKLGMFILGNNDISMASAALVIRDFWIAIESPTDFSYSTFETFTKKYVGPAISDADLTRRWSIWQKYFP
jgi:hypothetical protein